MPNGILKVKCFGDTDFVNKDILALDNERDIIDINSYEGFLVILKKDGTVLTVG